MNDDWSSPTRWKISSFYRNRQRLTRKSYQSNHKMLKLLLELRAEEKSEFQQLSLKAKIHEIMVALYGSLVRRRKKLGSLDEVFDFITDNMGYFLLELFGSNNPGHAVGFGCDSSKLENGSDEKYPFQFMDANFGLFVFKDIEGMKTVFKGIHKIYYGGLDRFYLLQYYENEHSIYSELNDSDMALLEELNE